MKSFRLSENTISLLEGIADEKKVSMTKALEEMIHRYTEKKDKEKMRHRDKVLKYAGSWGDFDVDEFLRVIKEGRVNKDDPPVI